MNRPSIIQDARTDNVSESSIQRGIVQGVLKSTDLPTISNIIPGVGKEHFFGHQAGATGSKTPVLGVPKEERSSTKMVSGAARYLGSQKKH